MILQQNPESRPNILYILIPLFIYFYIFISYPSKLLLSLRSRSMASQLHPPPHICSDKTVTDSRNRLTESLNPYRTVRMICYISLVSSSKCDRQCSIQHWYITEWDNLGRLIGFQFINRFLALTVPLSVNRPNRHLPTRMASKEVADTLINYLHA